MDDVARGARAGERVTALAAVGVTATIAERVREACAARRRLRIQGASRWLDAGRPTAADDPLSLSDDRGIVEYVPGDLTLTARAGTRLSEIVHATRAHGQWLPLDPWGGDDGTVGATISTATAGPHAFSMGLPRDVVLGMEFVTGTGQVVRSGGRVVKNVAGFDLTRLLVGSWGTLGIITEVTVRLRARPPHSRSIAIAPDSATPALGELATKLRALPFVPLASELVNAGLAQHLGVGSRPTLLLRIGGNEKSESGQLDLLREFGAARDVDDDIWDRLRAAELPTAASWRWSRLPSLFGETWTAAETSTRDLDGTFIHASPMRGVVRVIARSGESADPARLAQSASAFDGTVVIERLPTSAWGRVRGRVAGDAVSRAIRDKFDPAGILNAGILGEPT